ncbi:acyl-coenzyme A dehydrogenase, partial [Danaus plexippus plexippus]
MDFVKEAAMAKYFAS